MYSLSPRPALREREPERTIKYVRNVWLGVTTLLVVCCVVLFFPNAGESVPFDENGNECGEWELDKLIALQATCASLNLTSTAPEGLSFLDKLELVKQRTEQIINTTCIPT